LSINPVTYLQTLIIFSAAASAATFVVPAIMLAYWRRATSVGTAAAMLAGAATIFGLLFAGINWGKQLGVNADAQLNDPSYFPFGCHPVVFGLLASLLAGIFVSLATSPPDEKLVSKLFDAPAT
jgi:Na+/proline symporter